MTGLERTTEVVVQKWSNGNPWEVDIRDSNNNILEKQLRNAMSTGLAKKLFYYPDNITVRQSDIYHPNGRTVQGRRMYRRDGTLQEHLFYRDNETLKTRWLYDESGTVVEQEWIYDLDGKTITVKYGWE